MSANRTNEAEQYARLISPVRLAALEATGLLDGQANDVLDRVARMVTRLVGAPTSLVSLVGGARQHFPGMVGLTGSASATRETMLSHSYCQYVVIRNAPLVIPDAAQEPLVRDNPARTESNIAAYVGVPLRTSEGEVLGALCAINSSPTPWSSEQIETLTELATMAMSEIQLRSTARALLLSNRRLAQQLVRDPVTGLRNRSGFLAGARQLVSDAMRSRSSMLMCVLNLNDFYHINATMGHDVGDAALVEVAALLEGALRDADVVARIGADDFVALIANASASDTPFVTARLAASFDVHNAMPNREFLLDASLGFAEWTAAKPMSITSLLQRAEAAMRQSRRRRAA